MTTFEPDTTFTFDATFVMDDPVCVNCRARPSTVNWVGSGGVIGYVHGEYARWCDRCANRAQFGYALRTVARLPRLAIDWVRLRLSP